MAAALGARLNDGYLLLVVPPWRAEISLNLFIIALFGLFLVSMRCCAFWPPPSVCRNGCAISACAASVTRPASSSRMRSVCSSKGVSAKP